MPGKPKKGSWSIYIHVANIISTAASSIYCFRTQGIDFVGILASRRQIPIGGQLVAMELYPCMHKP